MNEIRQRQFAEDTIDQDIDAEFDALQQEEAAEKQPTEAAGGLSFSGEGDLQFKDSIPGQVLGGLEDAFKNSMNAVFTIGEEVNSALPEDYQADFLKEIPKYDLRDPVFPRSQQKGVTGGVLDFVRSATQFLAPFGAASKALAVGKGVTGVTNVVASTALTGYFALDPAEDNLANVIQSVPELQNPIAEFLASDGTDSSVNRLKNGINEALLLGAGSGVARGVENIVEKTGIINQVTKLSESFTKGVKAVKDRRDFAKHGYTSETIKGMAKVKDAINENRSFAEDISDNYSIAAGKERTEDILTGKIVVGGKASEAKPQFQSRAIKLKDQLATRVFGKSPDKFDSVNILKSAGLVDDPVVADLMKFASEQTPKTKMAWDETNSRAFGMTVDEAKKRFGTTGDFTAAIGSIKNDAIVRAARLAEKVNKKGLDDAESVEALAQFLEASSIEKMISGEAGRALNSLKQTKSVASVLQNVDVITKREMEAVIKAMGNDPEKMLGFGRQLGKGKVSDIKAGLKSYWINNVLSGPVTHLTNITSNMAFLALRPLERLGASGVGVLTGNENVAAREALEMYYGFYEGMRDATKAIYRAEPVDKELAAVIKKGNKFDEGKNAASERGNMLLRKAITGREENLTLDEFKKMGPLGMGQELLARALTAPTDFLGATDEFIKSMAARGQKRALAFRSATDEGLKGADFDSRIKSLLNNSPMDNSERVILNNINEAAAEFARETTFQKELGKTGKALINLRDKVPGMEFVIPFVKTPINILDETFLKRTPIGLASKRIRGEILSGGAKGDEAIARMAIGTFITGTVAASYSSGSITGAGPAGKAAREKWLENHQPWSVKIGNRWYSYNKVEPLGSLIGLGARFSEVLEHNADSKVLSPEEEEELSFSLAAAFSKYVTDKSLMVGIENLLTALEGDEAGVEKFTSNVAGGFVPFSGAVRTVAGSVDPELKDMEGVLDRIASGIPGLSEDLPNLRNRFGDKVFRPERTVGYVLPIAYTPGGIKDDKTLKINEIENDAGVILSKPDRRMKGIELSLAEQDKRLEAFNNFKIDGVSVKDAIIQTAAMPEYQALPSSARGGKADLLKNIYRNYLDASDAKFLKESPEISDKIEKALMGTIDVERQINARTGEPKPRETFIGAPQ